MRAIKTKILMYKSSNGTIQVLELLNKADEKIKKKFRYQILGIGMQTDFIRAPHVKAFHIEKYKGIYEIRTKTANRLLRTIFFYDKNNNIILLYAFYKKASRDTQYALDKALKFIEEINELKDAALCEYGGEVV